MDGSGRANIPPIFTRLLFGRGIQKRRQFTTGHERNVRAAASSRSFPRRPGFPGYGLGGEMARQSTNVRTSAAMNVSGRPSALEFRRPYRIYSLTILRPTEFCSSTGISDRKNRPAGSAISPLLTDCRNHAGLRRQLPRQSIGLPVLPFYHFCQF